MSSRSPGKGLEEATPGGYAPLVAATTHSAVPDERNAEARNRLPA